AEVYYELTDCLSKDINVIGINPYNIYAHHSTIQDFSQLVDYYFNIIQSLSNHDRIFLGGWSFGGVLALEIAKKLNTHNPVDYIYMFDCLKMDKTINFFLSILLRFRWFYRLDD